MATASFTRPPAITPPGEVTLTLSEGEAYQLAAVLGAQSGIGADIFTEISRVLADAAGLKYRSHVQLDPRYVAARSKTKGAR